MQPATSAAAAPVAPGEAERVEVGYLDGEAYEVRVRGHGYASTSQPPWAAPTAPTPTELFVGPLAACVAFYAGRYLTHHDLHRGGLEVHTDFDMATDRPGLQRSGSRCVAKLPSRPTLRAPATCPAANAKPRRGVHLVEQSQRPGIHSRSD
jgi:putative redox protein